MKEPLKRSVGQVGNHSPSTHTGGGGGWLNQLGLQEKLLLQKLSTLRGVAAAS